jgi:hypothetical protein
VSQKTKQTELDNINSKNPIGHVTRPHKVPVRELRPAKGTFTGVLTDKGAMLCDCRENKFSTGLAGLRRELFFHNDHNLKADAPKTQYLFIEVDLPGMSDDPVYGFAWFLFEWWHSVTPAKSQTLPIEVNVKEQEDAEDEGIKGVQFKGSAIDDTAKIEECNPPSDYDQASKNMILSKAMIMEAKERKKAKANRRRKFARALEEGNRKLKLKFIHPNMRTKLPICRAFAQREYNPGINMLRRIVKEMQVTEDLSSNESDDLIKIATESAYDETIWCDGPAKLLTFPPSIQAHKSFLNCLSNIDKLGFANLKAVVIDLVDYDLPTPAADKLKIKEVLQAWALWTAEEIFEKHISLPASNVIVRGLPYGAEILATALRR